MASFKVVAFDCDGVMFDSDKANAAYYNRILNQVGLPDMTPAQFDYVHMHTVGDALSYLLPDEETYRAARAVIKNIGYFEFIQLMEIEPYLNRLLDKLRLRLKTAIATNRTNTMDRVLQEHGLEGRFDLVVCALDVSRPKPDPEMLLKVLAHFDVAADEMLYVGDSELDAMAANAAAIPFAAYGDSKLPADYHITSLREIEAIVL